MQYLLTLANNILWFIIVFSSTFCLFVVCLVFWLHNRNKKKIKLNQSHIKQALQKRSRNRRILEEARKKNAINKN